MKSDIPGLFNGHIVDERLTRSGEFLDFALAIPLLRELKISRVICFMGKDDQEKVDREKAALKEARLEFVNIPLDNSGIFSWHDGEKYIGTILGLIASTPTGERCHIHCKHGADRSGAVVACYRIKNYGWSADRAIDEMKKYGNAFYNWGMRAFVKDYAAHCNNEAKVCSSK